MGSRRDYSPIGGSDFSGVAYAIVTTPISRKTSVRSAAAAYGVLCLTLAPLGSLGKAIHVVSALLCNFFLGGGLEVCHRLGRLRDPAPGRRRKCAHLRAPLPASHHRTGGRKPVSARTHSSLALRLPQPRFVRPHRWLSGRTPVGGGEGALVIKRFEQRRAYGYAARYVHEPA